MTYASGLWQRQQHGIPGVVQVTHGPGQCPRPTRLRTPACEGPVSGAGRSATADSMLGPRCPRTGGHRLRAETRGAAPCGNSARETGHRERKGYRDGNNARGLLHDADGRLLFTSHLLFP